MQSRPPPSRTWFVCVGKRAQVVCAIAHREGSQCAKMHAVPPEAIWSGPVAIGEEGDLQVDLKAARKEYRRSLRQWRQTLAWLRCKIVAARFAAWRAAKIEELEKQRPAFVFAWPKAEVAPT
jgi:hypothetical protein